MTIHLILNETDADLIYWRNFLPPRTFGKYVCRILEAERNGQIADIPVPENLETEKGYLDLKFVINEKDLINFIESIPNWKRGTLIKSIIRKNIYENYVRKNQKYKVKVVRKVKTKKVCKKKVPSYRKGTYRRND